MRVRPASKFSDSQGCTILAGVLVSACLLGSGCADRRDKAGSQNSLTVAAAANLTEAFGEVAKSFRTETGIAVVYSFGATTNLELQAERSAPFDVFAAADAAHMDTLEKKGLVVPGSRAIYARGKLVLWVPAEGRAPIFRLEDLGTPAVQRIAIANPKLAPYGAAAVETLKKLGLWERLQNKLVYAGSISIAKQYAETGNTDAALTAYSLVIRSGGRIIPVPEDLHAPLDQAIAILSSSARQQQARRFVAFVLGNHGREILSRYGYDLPHKQ